MASETSGSASATVFAPSSSILPMRSPRRRASSAATSSSTAWRAASERAPHAGYAQPDGPRTLGLTAVGDHALEVGGGLQLRGVGGLGPAVRGRLHLLHGQV